MRHQPFSAVALSAVVLLSGCAQTASLLSTTADKMAATADKVQPVGKKASSKQSISRILCLWEASEGLSPDGTPARGFAGQILFFATGGAEPVEVQGTVHVYEFDDQGTIEEQSRPIHKFTFDTGAWNAHLTDSSLGPAYNVFIPYMKKQRFETACALRVKFEPEGGEAVYSELSSITLPGAARDVVGADGENKDETIDDIVERRLREILKKDDNGDKKLADDALENKLRTLTIRPGRQTQRRLATKPKEGSFQQVSFRESTASKRASRRFRLTPANHSVVSDDDREARDAELAPADDDEPAFGGDRPAFEPEESLFDEDEPAFGETDPAFEADDQGGSDFEASDFAPLPEQTTKRVRSSRSRKYTAEDFE